MSASNSSFSFRQTALGALIGLAASLAVTAFQSHTQTKLAVAEHRLKALSDLEQIVQGDTVHFLVDALDLKNRATATEFSNPGEREAFHERKLLLVQEYIALIGKVNVNVSIVNAVYSSKIGTVDLSGTNLASRNEPTAAGKSSNERDDNIAELEDARQVVFEKLIKGLQQEINRLPSPNP